MMRFTYDRLYKFGFAVSLSLCSMGQTIAAPIFYSASDTGSGFSSPILSMPNSVAASNAWDLAASGLGTIQLIDFESPYPTTPQTSLLLAPGVTLSSTVGDFTISADTWFNTMTLNTTSGGSVYAALHSCTPFEVFCFTPIVYTFSFANPIEAFGLYITGRGQHATDAPVLFFNDPILQSITSPFTSGDAGQFVGFTDVGAAISSVSILIGGSSFPIVPDTFAFDDVRFVSVPEPGSMSLILIGSVPITAYLFLRRKSRRNNWIRVN